MRSYYIRTATWGTGTPHIIDEEAMYQAERGLNYLNPDEYDYLCETDCIHDAKDFYFEEVSESWLDEIAEASRP